MGEKEKTGRACNAQRQDREDMSSPSRRRARWLWLRTSPHPFPRQPRTLELSLLPLVGAGVYGPAVHSTAAPRSQIFWHLHSLNLVLGVDYNQKP